MVGDARVTILERQSLGRQTAEPQDRFLGATEARAPRQGKKLPLLEVPDSII